MDDPAFYMPQDMTQITAGVIGFSGVNRRDNPFQRVLYTYGNALTPPNDAAIMDVSYIKALIMWFTAGAFA